MKMLNVLSAVASILASLTVAAHEGHNHDAPQMLMPLKGGIIKTFNITPAAGSKDANCFVEVVKSKSDLKIFFFNAAQKSVDAKDFQLTASALPFSSDKSKQTATDLALTIDEKTKQFFKTSYDKKTAHKYDLTLKFKNEATCKCNEEITIVID